MWDVNPKAPNEPMADLKLFFNYVGCKSTRQHKYRQYKNVVL